MTIAAEEHIPEVPFPVADHRFDQKNEMFKRSLWDEKIQAHGIRFYREVKFREKAGYRQLDYALRNAAWNLEWGFAMCIPTGFTHMNITPSPPSIIRLNSPKAVTMPSC